jgi:signal transduction histidine kinase
MEIISSYSLLPLVSGILVFILGVFVWLKKPRELLHILFFFFNFTITIWLLGTFMLFNSTVEFDQLYWDRFIYIGVVFSDVFMYHFGLIYCNVKNQNRILAFGYLQAFIFLPLTQLSNNFVSGLYHYSWGVHAIARVYHHIFVALFAFFLCLFLWNLVNHYKRSEGKHKDQVKFVLIGYAIFVFVGPLAFLPAYGVPVYPIVFLVGVAFSGLMGYAVIWHNALDVRTIATEVLVAFLNILALGQIFFSRSITEIFIRSVVLVAVAGFSLMLVRSVRKEVKRREEMATLADSLVKANAKLQEFDKQKTDFLSIAAHQLRTPLSIANGYLELLTDGAYGKITKEAKDVIHNMDVSNGHLVKLVDSFLDITRLEQGRTKYDFVEHDLNTLVDGVVNELIDRAAQKNLHILWRPQNNPAKALYDEEKIRHVVFNYIDNAIKYTDSGPITVSLVEEGGGLSVRVKDGGLGFDKVDETNFFQKFYRGNNVKGINVNGTGLGLYVCAKFIEAHHGRVWAHSEGLGKGGEFGFWIPLHA